MTPNPPKIVKTEIGQYIKLVVNGIHMTVAFDYEPEEDWNGHCKPSESFIVNDIWIDSEEIDPGYFNDDFINAVCREGLRVLRGGINGDCI